MAMKTYTHSGIPRIALSLLLAAVSLPSIAETKFVYRIPFKAFGGTGQSSVPSSALVLTSDTGSVFFTTGLSVADGSKNAMYCVKGATSDMTTPPAVVSLQGVSLRIRTSWNYFGGFCLDAGNVPPMAEGDYPITLVDGTGKTATGVISYVTQVKPPPTVASVTPSYGSSRGYATVEVQGTGFEPKAQATADGMALKTKYISSSRLQVEIPPSAEMGRPLALDSDHNLDIRVANPGTTSSGYTYTKGWARPDSSIPGYVYHAGIKVLALDPFAPKTGDLVTLSGEGLFKNMVLKIGNTVVTIQSFSAPESNGYMGSAVTFRMPPLASGSYALTAKIPEFDAVTYQYPIVVSTP